MLARLARPLNWLSVGLLTFCIVGASFNAYYSRWGLREKDHRFSLEAIADGTAQRPWAYRRMLPDIAFAVSNALPEQVERSVRSILVDPAGVPRSGAYERQAADPRFSIPYHIVMYLVVLTTFLAFLSFFMLCRSIGTTPLVAYTASAIALLAIPVIQTEGAYYYDMLEFACLSLFLLCARNGQLRYLPLIVAVATWNKEAFLFFLPCAYPMLRTRVGRQETIVLLGLCVLISAVIYQIARIRFANNPGAPTEFHLWDQLSYFVSARQILRPDRVYSIVGPPAFVPLAAFVIAGVFVRAWSGLRPEDRQSILIALAINVPLFLLFCAPAELRNLSMLLPGAVMSVAICCQRLLDGAHGAGGHETASLSIAAHSDPVRRPSTADAAVTAPG